MSDEFDYERTDSERAEPVQVGAPRRRMSKLERIRARRTHTRRRIVAAAAVAVLAAIVLAVILLGTNIFHGGGGSDYAGDGKDDIVIQVHDGDSTTQIAQTLRDRGVVANVKSFVDAAKDNSAIAAIQPGFYKMRTEMSASAAVQSKCNAASSACSTHRPQGKWASPRWGS